MNDPGLDLGSRYHVFRQHDGRGFGILRQDDIGSDAATIIDANLPEAEARAALAAYRREEGVEPPRCAP